MEAVANLLLRQFYRATYPTTIGWFIEKIRAYNIKG